MSKASDARQKEYFAKQPKALDFDKDIAKFTPRQLEACAAIDSGLYKFILYGGALGGGKSYFLRWVLVRLLMAWFFEKGLSNVKVMLCCEDYPQLKDRQIEKIEREFPEWLGKSYSDHKSYGRCFMLHSSYGGGIICFRNLDDASKYQSSEWAAVAVDELTKNDYDTFTEVRKRLRWPGLADDECLFLGATNPGGIGHNYCKAFWIDKIFPDEFKAPYDYTKKFCYIPAKADDNPHLDEGYWMMLNTLPAHQRAAFRDGSWDLFIGQAFGEWSRSHHVIKPLPVPKDAPLFMTFDWGFGAPFSVGWWWLDSDGRFYRFAEWYGWNGTPNQGMRLSDSEIADGIRKREESMGFAEETKTDNGIVFNSRIHRLCDPTCFNKKPDYRGGGQGPSTADEFRAKGLILRPGDPSRVLKWRQVHQRLYVPMEGDKVIGVPMVQVYDSCIHFIRTIPNIVVNPNNPEDIECFIAGTQISTPSGMVPVERIDVGDYVTTPLGPRKVIKSGLSGISSTVIVTFSDGTVLEGTPDHKIFIENIGLLPLCKVSSGQIPGTEEDICKLRLSEGLNLQSVPTEDILNAIQVIQKCSGRHCFTEQSGLLKEAISPKGTLFTTETIMVQTMILQTLNSLLRVIMQDTISKKDLLPVAISESVLIDGLGPMTENELRLRILGSAVQILPKENLRALIVANFLLHNTQQKNIVQTNVTTPITQGDTYQKYAQYAEQILPSKNIALKKSKPVVTSVVGCSEKKKVYHLTIEQAHLFYANGVLATNTTGEDHIADEFALLCMARPMSIASWNQEFKQKEDKRKRPDDISGIAHMELEEFYRNQAGENVNYGW